MIRKFLASMMLFVLVFKIPYIVFSSGFSEEYLYYGDKDKNGKIDTIEVHFNQDIFGEIDFDKLILYSEAGGLSSERLSSVSGMQIFSGFQIRGNILEISLIEQDLLNTNFLIDNTTKSHLRLRNNTGVGISNISGDEIKLSYTTSFASYINVSYKEYEDENNEDDNSGDDEGVPDEGEEELPPPIEDEGGGEDENNEDENTGDDEGVPDDGEEELPPPIEDEGGGEDENNEDENTGDDEGVPDEGEDELPPPIEDEGGGEDENTGDDIILPNFSLKNIFQSPSYILEKEIDKNEYFCDRNYPDCRVNFQLLLSENQEEFENISTSKYECVWDFGSEEFESEKNKCNPNTLTLPIGENLISYTVFLKSDPEILIQKSFVIQNPGYIPPPPKIIYVGGGGGGSISNISIDNPIIEIQSGLDENNYCEKQDCQINLMYTPKNTQEKCQWSFIGGTFSNNTDTRCNPGFVKYPFGSFEVKLRVYQENNVGNYKESTLLFVNQKQDNNIQEGDDSIAEVVSEELKNIQAKIILQGSLGKNKTLSGNILTCLTESCSVNFDAESQKSGEYVWDFGNGEMFFQKNPPAFSYQTGEYKIKLEIFENDEKRDEDFFEIKVGMSSSIQEKTLQEIQEIQQKYPLFISRVLPNPAGVDHSEFIEIYNNSDRDISLEGCFLDDELGKASKPYFFLSYDNLSSGEVKRFYKFDTNINLLNSAGEQVSLICEGVKIDFMQWNFVPPEDFIIEKNLLEKGLKSVKKDTKNQVYEVIFFSEEQQNLPIHNTSSQTYRDVISQVKTMQQLSGFSQESKEYFQTYIHQTFSQKISKQKSGIKISGNTLPNIPLLFELRENYQDISLFQKLFTQAYASQNYETKSDKNGYYETFISHPPIGNFEIITFLKTSETGKYEIPEKKILEIDQDYIDYINPEVISQGEEGMIQAKITVQGRIAQKNTLTPTKIICRGVDECRVNFDGRQSQGKNLSYFWDFGNGQTFEKSNPASYLFTTGNHVISLTVSRGEQKHTAYFAVQVIPKLLKEAKITIPKQEKSDQQTFSSFEMPEKTFPLMYHFLYSGLILFLFSILSIVILRQRNLL